MEIGNNFQLFFFKKKTWQTPQPAGSAIVHDRKFCQEKPFDIFFPKTGNFVELSVFPKSGNCWKMEKFVTAGNVWQLPKFVKNGRIRKMEKIVRTGRIRKFPIIVKTGNNRKMEKIVNTNILLKNFFIIREKKCWRFGCMGV